MNERNVWVCFENCKFFTFKGKMWKFLVKICNFGVEFSIFFSRINFKTWFVDFLLNFEDFLNDFAILIKYLS